MSHRMSRKTKILSGSLAMILAGLLSVAAWGAYGGRPSAALRATVDAGAHGGAAPSEVAAPAAGQAGGEAAVDPQAFAGAATPAVTNDASAPVGTTTTADAGEAASPERYVIPEDVEYDPETTIVSFSEGATVEEVNAALAQTSSVQTKEVTEEDLANGYVTLEVSDGASVEDAINDLRDEGPIDEAQPNFIYYMLAGTEADLRNRLSETFTAAADELPADEAVTAPDGGEASTSEAAQDEGVAEEGVSDTEAATATDTVVEPAGDDDIVTPEVGDGTSSTDPETTDAETTETFEINDPYSLPDSDKQWALSSIRAYEAWAVTRCEGSVSIAILDNRPKVTHDDLAGVVKATYDAYTETTDAWTPNTHGTHVAGIATAEANNGIGIAGVSFNAGLVAVNIFDENLRSDTAKLLKAYDIVTKTAETYNTHVINLSLGVKKNSNAYSERDKQFIAAVEDAYDNYGIVTVAAAGNSGSNSGVVPYPEYPGDASRVVSVINLTRDSSSGEVARYTESNYNEPGDMSKNISAPGARIYSTWTIPAYSTLTGTSMASPHVTGVLALVFAANPNLRAKEAVSVVYASARDLGDEGWDEEYGFGEVDAYAAVTTAKDSEAVAQAVSYVDSVMPVIPTPTATGATRIPVGATAAFEVTDGSLALTGGDDCATLEDNVLTGTSAGTVTLSLLDVTGKEQDTLTVEVYDTTGTWTIATAIDDSGLVLDVEGASLYNTANVRLYTANGTRAQGWVISQQGNGTVVLRNARTGKALDVAAGSLQNSANVRQYACNETAAQSWEMSVDAQNRITFVNINSGKVLDVSGGVAAVRRNVQQYTANDSVAQKWVLAKADLEMGPIWDGIYRVSSGIDATYVLDVAGGSTANGANVQLYTANGTDAQKWKVEFQGDESYRVTCLKSGRVLDVAGGSLNKGANVRQWGWNASGAQLWKVVEHDEAGYELVNAKSGLALDVAGGKATNGRNVQQYTSNGSPAQRWSLAQY